MFSQAFEEVTAPERCSYSSYSYPSALIHPCIPPPHLSYERKKYKGTKWEGEEWRGREEREGKSHPCLLQPKFHLWKRGATLLYLNGNVASLGSPGSQDARGFDEPHWTARGQAWAKLKNLQCYSSVGCVCGSRQELQRVELALHPWKFFGIQSFNKYFLATCTRNTMVTRTDVIGRLPLDTLIKLSPFGVPFLKYGWNGFGYEIACFGWIICVFTGDLE